MPFAKRTYISEIKIAETLLVRSMKKSLSNEASSFPKKLFEMFYTFAYNLLISIQH